MSRPVESEQATSLREFCAHGVEIGVVVQCGVQQEKRRTRTLVCVGHGSQ